jgi:predicted ATP-grasp superfamily ATP-dependent carboligase
VYRENFRHPAIVLGLGQNSLATVGDLARQGIPVIGVDANLTQPTANTCLCHKVACPDFRGEGLLQCLPDLGRTLPAKVVLFPAGDINLDLVSERREVLREWLSSYHGRRTHALAAWDDPGPSRAARLLLCKRPLSLLRLRKGRTVSSPLQPLATRKSA